MGERLWYNSSVNEANFFVDAGSPTGEAHWNVWIATGVKFGAFNTGTPGARTGVFPRRLRIFNGARDDIGGRIQGVGGAGGHGGAVLSGGKGFPAIHGGCSGGGAGNDAGLGGGTAGPTGGTPAENGTAEAGGAGGLWSTNDWLHNHEYPGDGGVGGDALELDQDVDIQNGFTEIWGGVGELWGGGGGGSGAPAIEGFNGVAGGDPGEQGGTVYLGPAGGAPGNSVKLNGNTVRWRGYGDLKGPIS
jgi:hypothetical protein